MYRFTSTIFWEAFRITNDARHTGKRRAMGGSNGDEKEHVAESSNPAAIDLEQDRGSAMRSTATPKAIK